MSLSQTVIYCEVLYCNLLCAVCLVCICVRGRGWVNLDISQGWDIHLEERGIWSIWSMCIYCPIGYSKIRGLTVLIV